MTQDMDNNTMPVNEARDAYIKVLRARTAYPTFRTVTRTVATCLCLLGVLCVVAAVSVVAIGMSYDSRPFAAPLSNGVTAFLVLALLAKAVLCFVIGWLLDEIAEIFADASDCLINMSFQTCPVSVKEGEMSATIGPGGESQVSADPVQPAEPDGEQHANRLLQSAAEAAKGGDKQEALRLLKLILKLHPGTQAARRAERSIPRGDS